MTSFSQPADHGAPTGALPAQSLIPLSAIDPSPFNPRKTFDDIDELAESIKAQGLLENLVVRPAKKAGRYELIAGERRFRALQKLKAGEVPCKVIAADDGQARAAQIVENLQRADVNPLEEAEGFKGLQDADPKRWTVQAIAASVGKTPRFVQQRLAIARNLAAPFKAKVAEGSISIEAARTLAQFPAAAQTSVPNWAVEEHTADELRRRLFEQCIPESAAKFDVKLYDGEWIEGQKGRRYFADTSAFRKLQTAPAMAKLAEVKKEWPDARLIEPEDAEKLCWADAKWFYGSGLSSDQRNGDKPSKFLVPKEKCTAVVWIARNGEIRKALGVCSKQALEAAERKRQTASSTRVRGGAATLAKVAKEPKEHKAARETFTKAVRLAAGKNADFVSRLQLFNLLRLIEDSFYDTLDDMKQLLPKPLAKEIDFDEADGRSTVWNVIAKLTIAQVRDALKALTLANLPDWQENEWDEQPQLMVAMAETLGVKPPAIALPEPPKPAPAKTTATATVKAEPKAVAKAKAKKKGGRK